MASSSPSEHEIQQRIRLACGCGAVRLWCNNSGALVDQQGRFVSFRLCKGSSDLIGLRSLEITPEQRAFLRIVQELGSKEIGRSNVLTASSGLLSGVPPTDEELTITGWSRKHLLH